MTSLSVRTSREQHGKSPRASSCLALFTSLVVGFVALLPARALDLRGPELDLLQGRVDGATAALLAATANDPHNAAAHLLLCRAYLSEELATQAAQECEKALQSGLAGSSEAQDWAGRAFGREAERAGPLSGLHLAAQVRVAFQTAHKLNPRSAPAANDLGEFLIDAPFIVGGGADKAETLINEIQPALPEIARRLRGLLAEKHNDMATAERELIAATQVAQSPGAFVDLSTFYVRQRKLDRAVAAARQAIAVDRDLDADAVEAAGSLADTGQDKPALITLRAYLAHGRKSDQAPAFRVHTSIGQLLAREGDKNGARSEFQQALALASAYAPARKGLGAL